MAMPIYEYECKKCGCRFDLLQSMGDPPPTTCGHNGCRGRVRKVLSPPAVIFKGSGFYSTDYARGGRNGDGSKKKHDPELIEGRKPATESKPAKDSAE